LFRNILILGAGKSGLAAGKLLTSPQGKNSSFLPSEKKKIIISDSHPAKEFNSLFSQLKRKGVELKLGPQEVSLLKNCDLIIKSPGVPGEISLLKAARKRKIKIISELELAYYLRPPSKIIAITGTNGKSTTTILLGKILKLAFKTVLVGGNLNTPFSELILKASQQKNPFFVLEVSSFQLEDTFSFKPDLACILNLSPNHLDRHKTMAQYVQAKTKVFSQQSKKDILVLKKEDSYTSLFSKQASSQIYYFSENFHKKSPKVNAYLKENNFYLQIPSLSEGEEKICSQEEIQLKGEHNYQNILAASLLARLLKVDLKYIREAVRNFKGLPHRLEPVRRKGGISFINDSKATTPEAVEKALTTLTSPILLIMGGKEKGGDFSILQQQLKKKVKKCFLIGEARKKIKKVIGKTVPCVEISSLPEAVLLSVKEAKKGDCILLSPGCASFDQFANFEERGNLFKTIVKHI
jgi:UDP-N-acetylmuramoylalanine--D-glutamate ligase